MFIVGVGIFGIGLVYYLGKYCFGKFYVIFEGCENLGGIWDLFKYFGICLDSDMLIFGYGFKLWIDEKVIVDVLCIFDYLCEMICENGID